MSISDEFVDKAISDPVGAALELVDSLVSHFPTSYSRWDSDDLRTAIEAYSFLCELNEAGLVTVPTPKYKPSGVMSTDGDALMRLIGATRTVLISQRSDQTIDSDRQRFRQAFGKALPYELTQGDLARVQVLLNELRDLIRGASDLDEAHRQRVLTSLEKLQKELHKKLSDFDRYYGLAAQISSLVHKIGSDAKPITDRMREIVGIAWNTQARGDELPSGTQPPLLTKSSGEDGSDHL